MALAAAGLMLLGIDILAMDDVAPLIRSAGILAAGVLFYAYARSAALRLLGVVFVLGIVLILTWPGQDGYGLLDVFERTGAGGLLSVYLRLWLCAIAAILAWALAARSRHAALWSPLAWGLVCLTQVLALLAPATAVFGPGGSPDAKLVIIRLACASLPVAVLAVLLRSRAEVAAPWRVGAPAVLAVASIGWMGAPGVSVALSWLILGYGLARRSLLGFGALALLAYLGLYYTMLEVTLLQKSGILGLTGTWLLISWLVSRTSLQRSVRARTGAAGSGDGPSRRAWPVAGLLAGLLLVLSVANTAIYQRERILAAGQRIVLALAPVDPRSLIQGDYMALRFAVADQWDATLARTPAAVAEQIRAQRGGYLVLEADEHGVHQLAALMAEWDDSIVDTASSRAILAFRLRPQGIRIVTDAWFFSEGQGARFEVARYGELRVDARGNGLLTGMLDAHRRPLP
jgi:uncharacterized membrane-anchored protein